MPALSLLLAAAFALCAPGPRTTCVVDGDTFWLQGEKVRIADINAPETHGAECLLELTLGDRATLRLMLGPLNLPLPDRATATVMAACCVLSPGAAIAWALRWSKKAWLSTGRGAAAAGASVCCRAEASSEKLNHPRLWTDLSL
jgi:hypothetical protein